MAAHPTLTMGVSINQWYPIMVSNPKLFNHIPRYSIISEDIQWCSTISSLIHWYLWYPIQWCSMIFNNIIQWSHEVIFRIQPFYFGVEVSCNFFIFVFWETIQRPTSGTLILMEPMCIQILRNLWKFPYCGGDEWFTNFSRPKLHPSRCRSTLAPPKFPVMVELFWIGHNHTLKNPEWQGRKGEISQNQTRKRKLVASSIGIYVDGTHIWKSVEW